MGTVTQCEGGRFAQSDNLEGEMMQPHEVLRRAAEIIATGGWSSGAVARDVTGRPVSLYGGNARVGVNGAAASFSLYGAVCKALFDARCTRAPLVWDVLHRHSSAAVDAAHGGKNPLHPVLLFNDGEGRTQDEVLALLEAAAAECEQIGDGPSPPPVTADPKQVEAL